MIYNKKTMFILDYQGILQNIYLVDDALYFKIEDSKKNSVNLIANNILYFSADIDSNGQICIACINKKGNLIIYNKDDKWKNRFITNFNLDLFDFEYFKLHVSSYKIHILLLKKNKIKNTNWELLHYIIKNTSWKEYLIKEISVSYSSPLIKSDLDVKDNLHVIYKAASNENVQLFYIMYNNLFEKWTNVKKISSAEEKVLNINILSDLYNTIYIIYTSILNKEIKVHLIRKNIIEKTKKYIWNTFDNLPYGISAITYPVLILWEDCIKLIWKKNRNIYTTQLNSSGKWSEISSIDISSKQLIPIAHKSLRKNLNKSINAPLTYGYKENKQLLIMGIDKIQEKNIKIADVNFHLKSNNVLTSNLNKVINDTELNKDNDPKIKFTPKKNFFSHLNTCKSFLQHNDITIDLLSQLSSSNKKRLEYNNSPYFATKKTYSKNINSQNREGLRKNLFPNYMYEKEMKNHISKLFVEIEKIKENEVIILDSIIDIQKEYKDVTEKLKEIIDIYNSSKLIGKKK